MLDNAMLKDIASKNSDRPWRVGETQWLYPAWGRHTFGKIDGGHHLFRFWSDRESRIAACWLRSRMYGSDWCVLTRRDCFEQVGGIDESDDQRCRFCWQLANPGYSSMMAAPAIDLQ
jgi:hypothetical protein